MSFNSLIYSSNNLLIVLYVPGTGQDAGDAKGKVWPHINVMLKELTV